MLQPTIVSNTLRRFQVTHLLSTIRTFTTTTSSNITSTPTIPTTKDNKQPYQAHDIAPGLDMTVEEAYRKLRSGIVPSTGGDLNEVIAHVWEHIPISERAKPGERSPHKLLRKPLRGQEYVNHYPERIESVKELGMGLTEQQERYRKKLKLLRARGKGPPKKGEGKRSKK